MIEEFNTRLAAVKQKVETIRTEAVSLFYLIVFFFKKRTNFAKARPCLSRTRYHLQDKGASEKIEIGAGGNSAKGAGNCDYQERGRKVGDGIVFARRRVQIAREGPVGSSERV